MKLDNFDLVEFDWHSSEHVDVIRRISSKYLGDISYMVDRINLRKEEDFFHNKFYIAYYNDRPIGFISITHKDFGYEISSGLVPEERGYYLGPMLLQEFSEEIFRVMPEIHQLVLKISSTNVKGQKSAIRAGYEPSKSDNEMFVQRRIK